MRNSLFKKADQADTISMEQVLQRHGWDEQTGKSGLIVYTQPGKGMITLNAAGWTHMDASGKELDFGSDERDLNDYMAKKVNPHPESGFYRPDRLKAQPKNLGLDEVPEFSDEDKKWLRDVRIGGHLRKRVRAAYMNGYAEQAAAYLRQHGNTPKHAEEWANKNGLKSDYFKEAIQTMSRYASVRRKLASVCPKCDQPIKDTEMVSMKEQAHVACPRLASAKKAADPKWVGWATPPLTKQRKKWDMGGPLEKKRPSVLPYAGNNPLNPKNIRPKMEPPVVDTPEFAKAISNIMILHKKKAIGESFAVVFPEPMMEVAPEIVKEFRNKLKNRLKSLQWDDQFKMVLDARSLIVQRVKASWETDQPTPRGLGEIDDYLDKRIEELIQVPASWLYRLMPKTSARRPMHSLAVPMSSAAHVAHHLATAGLLDFEVETDEDTEESFFSFPSDAELEVAHEIIRHAFKHQIKSGKGQWANWKQLEPFDTEPTQKPMMSSKQAGAWGERSYDNDSVHDILDKHRRKPGRGGSGFDEPVPTENLKALFSEMDTLIDNAHTPDDQARFFGVMVFLMTHGVKLDTVHRGLAIEIGRELAGNQDYLKQWRDPDSRKTQLQSELKLFGDHPFSFNASGD